MSKIILGKTSEIPRGTSRTYVKNGKKILVANCDGQFIAYENFCPHMGGALRSHGGCKIKCSWHGAEFDTKTGVTTNEVVPGGTLKPMTVSVEGDSLYWEPAVGEKSPYADDF